MSDTITNTTLIGQAKCEDKPGFVAYASSHIEKLQDEGRYSHATYFDWQKTLSGTAGSLTTSDSKARNFLSGGKLCSRKLRIYTHPDNPTLFLSFLRKPLRNAGNSMTHTLRQHQPQPEKDWQNDKCWLSAQPARSQSFLEENTQSDRMRVIL